MRRTAFLIIAAVVVSMRVSAAEPIGTALSCGREGAAGGLAAGTDMTRVTIDTKRYPEAVCNDGTPAIFYFARHTRPEDRDKWIIFLQGGGSCGSGQLCAQRWCSIDSNFGMDKMSSSLSKPSIRASGFLRTSPDNEFGTWNRVLVYYCSSDGWAGTATQTVQATAAGRTVDFDIAFKGSYIIDAVIDTLRYAGKRRLVGRPAAQWPDLDEAESVLFAGSSGGGNGVRHNADRVAAKLDVEDFRAVIDAIYAGGGESIDYAGSAFCETDPAGCTYETFMKAAWDKTYIGLHGARADESCLQWHTFVEPGTEWRCGDNEHVVRHHITTPFFMRADLLDNNLSGNFVEAGFGTREDFARRVESDLRNLPVPEDARDTTPGLFVPQCTHHEAFTNSEAVFGVKVDGVTFHDAVWNWFTNRQPQQLIRQFTGTAAPAPECP